MTSDQLNLLVDLINTATWSLIGTLWALIFAVTWRG